ncbi:ABC transporter permease [Paenibacillus frigoriresistens]|uniref:ABC transporter permease n=1 Tax=Paenibacillus alginolyticus TaxID=59839 RepID=UPI0015667D97|nr:ABC transporter permease [Paenibacillus frigoriresistens]NRF95912.1 ABC transporter permease [Paenibacillus frigoriresistens]
MKNEAKMNPEVTIIEKADVVSNRMTPQVIQDNKVSVILFILLFIITAILAPEFYNMQNIINVTRQASVIGVVSVGMTFVILAGGIDLSVGAIFVVVGVSFASMIKQGVPLSAAILFSLIIGIIGGFINGIGVTFFGIQPFIMTLGTMAVGNGVALLISNGTPISFKSESSIINLLGNGAIAGVPGPVIIFILSAVVAGIVLRFLYFGRFVYGIGGSLEAARLSGVRTTRILIVVYIISGLCTAIAGIIGTSRLFVGSPTAGGSIMLDSIAAVVIGGTSLMGGRGSILGTVAGVFLLAMVANLLNLLGVPPFNQQIAKGVIIIAAILFTSQGLRQRIKQQWSGL